MNVFAAALLASILAPGAINAQQSPAPRDTLPKAGSEAPPPRSDTARVTALEPVRVNARRRRNGADYSTSLNSSALKVPTRLRGVPQAVSIVTRQLIRDRSIQSMADVVRYMSGITAGQGEGNRDQIVIRGNSSTADFFVDGVRDDAQFFRDMYNVERVEALKGPNAMIFGRGGGGGILNRVLKEPGWIPAREVSLEGGAYGHARASTDVGFAPTSSLATRVMGVYESSNSFRDGVTRKRYGINPAATTIPRAGTTLRFDFEHFRDQRTADRGIPSFEGRPFRTNRSTFFGDPRESFSDARVNAASATLARANEGRLHIRNHTRFASYDKFYQNVFPGAMSTMGSEVSISAYNNRTQRTNLFNQTDVTIAFSGGRTKHLLLLGAEAGRQATENVRTTGYFNNSATSVMAPASAPTISIPVTYRQSAGDADNRVRATVLSAYAQDQITFGSHWVAVAGFRYERFDVDYHNNRDNTSLGRRDAMISPRMGIIHKPTERLSIYGAFGVSYLPSSGDQFSSLTDVTRALRPEQFTNNEIGAKWEISAGLDLSAAWYKLDRSNTRATDPNDPTKTVQTGSQRTTGYEIDLRGAVTPVWDVVAGFSHQNARIRSATTAGPAGAIVPLAPRKTASLWNRYQLSRHWGLGGGITYQARSYAAIDNTVKLPAFTELDAALFYLITGRARLQINADNLLNAEHYHTSNGNNNISPGEPRSVRLSIGTEF